MAIPAATGRRPLDGQRDGAEALDRRAVAEGGLEYGVVISEPRPVLGDAAAMSVINVTESGNLVAQKRGGRSH